MKISMRLVSEQAFTLAQLFGVRGELSAIARRGSGSACRSMYGGVVRWTHGEQADGADSIAVQVIPESYWPELRIFILVVSPYVCPFDY